MTVSVESAISGPFTPNGATTVFPFTFKAGSASEVIVVDQDGAQLSSALFSVDLDEDEGGSVTFSVAPSASAYDSLYILSDVALTQTADFDNAGTSFNPAALTRALDRAAVRDLKQQMEIDRTIKVPFGEAGLSLPASADRANLYPVFDADGNLSTSAGTGADAGMRADLAAGTGAGLVGGLNTSFIFASQYGLNPNSGQDETNRINDMLAEISASTTLPTTVLVPLGDYQVWGIIPQSNVDLVAAGYMHGKWGRLARRPRFYMPDGVSEGYMVRDDTGSPTISDAGFFGIYFDGRPGGDGNSSGEGFGAFSLTHTSRMTISGNRFRYWGEEALKVQGGAGIIEHNFATDCLQYRTRSALCAVFDLTINDIECHNNEVTPSSQFDPDGSARTGIYNGTTPYMAAGWSKGGSGHFTRNLWETAEIGFIDDGWHDEHIADRFDLTFAEGFISRVGGSAFIIPYFRANGSGDNVIGEFPCARITLGNDQPGFNPNGKPSRQIIAPVFLPDGTDPFVANRFSYHFVDEVYDLAPVYSGRTFYVVNTETDGASLDPVSLSTNDPDLRLSALTPPPLPVNRGENGVTNTATTGAVVGTLGSGGALPTGWASYGFAGLTVAVTAIASVDGFDKLTVHISGTSSGTFGGFRFIGQSRAGMPVTVGEKISLSAFVRLIAGSTTNVTSRFLQTEWLQEDGTLLAAGTTVAADIAGTLHMPFDECRHSGSITVVDSGAGTKRANITLGFGITNASAVDMTLEIALPQIEHGDTAGLPQHNTFKPKFLPARQTEVPTTGQTKQINNYVTEVWIDPAGTLATLTLTMPPVPYDGQRVESHFSQVITALTYQASTGHSFAVAAPTSAAVGDKIVHVFRSADAKWYPA